MKDGKNKAKTRAQISRQQNAEAQESNGANKHAKKHAPDRQKKKSKWENKQQHLLREMPAVDIYMEQWNSSPTQQTL